MNIIVCGVAIGFLLDLLIGDPEWLPHPVVAIGRLISALERRLIKSKNKVVAGGVMVCLVCVISFLTPLLILLLAYLISPWLCLGINALMCFQIFATKCLAVSANRVKTELCVGVQKGRDAVAMIVGRDTSQLTSEGIIKATVETVAENTTDGVVAPMIFMAIGGAPLGFLYKAINTMDSMVGYKNDKYLDFGRIAAKTDDVANYIPSRIAALLMIPASLFAKLDVKGALQIWKRDRRKHASPNSAQTEAVCAGALGVALAGDAVYFGKLYKKQYIGDAKRDIEAADIGRANSLLYATAVIGMFVVLATWAGIFILT